MREAVIVSTARTPIGRLTAGRSITSKDRRSPHTLSGLRSSEPG